MSKAKNKVSGYRWPKVWAALNYPLTKGVAWMHGAGIRVRAAVLVVGPVGIALMWRESSDSKTDGNLIVEEKTNG